MIGLKNIIKWTEDLYSDLIHIFKKFYNTWRLIYSQPTCMGKTTHLLQMRWRRQYFFFCTKPFLEVTHRFKCFFLASLYFKEMFLLQNYIGSFFVKMSRSSTTQHPWYHFVLHERSPKADILQSPQNYLFLYKEIGITKFKKWSRLVFRK